jgi:hypothetical protein
MSATVSEPMEIHSMSDGASQPVSLSRRWTQFRLRSLLLLTVGLCVVLALLAPRVQSYRHEWRIERELNRLPHAAIVHMASDAPGWLRPLGAERYMQRIRGVQLDDGNDDSLALVVGLPALEWLEVHSAKVTDDGIKHLEGCKPLFKLDLDCPNISDRGLESLAKLSELGILNLKAPRITDAGLKSLSNLKELRDLKIIAPNVGDDGMRHIGGLALWRLSIFASVGDRGLAHLVTQPNPRWPPGQVAKRLYVTCVRPGKEHLAEVLWERTEADFKDQPLCDVLEYISQRHAISVSTLDDLQKAGIDPMTPITFQTPTGPGSWFKGRGYLLYDLLNELLTPVGLDWRLGSTTDIEVLPRETLSPQRPNLLKLRAAWPECPVIVDW